ncbi:Transglycosylase [Geosporobacter subterraneus DSM 17957]|uniref:Penicillin-binding protein 1A n=1 Tax=Geosporobacter subterraneus DSM 17957 TaxID=1121919 RepID=A0A1M6H3Q1_9FIRM|nr:biosynthetic peptidoglycan transglycosylase [Geosporobacter subterraneus]SHJ16789.1 Transglycosylase [Geosporobacter subterraneus DSM 17957]
MVNTKQTIAVILFIVFSLNSTVGLYLILRTGEFFADTLSDVPTVDPTQMNNLLSQHSVIYDDAVEELEIIQTLEFRDIVEIDKIPSHVKNVFIAIEDERFKTHMGVDYKRILGALLINLEKRAPVQGASTITQQLVKNLYLSVNPSIALVASIKTKKNQDIKMIYKQAEDRMYNNNNENFPCINFNNATNMMSVPWQLFKAMVHF